MRTIFTKVVIGIAITAIGVLGADNSLGTWKRNIEKSTSSTPSGPRSIKSLTIVKEASDDGVKTTATGERMNSEPINSSSTAKYDGKEYPATGAAWDTVSMKQIDANTFTSEAKKTGGQYHTTSRTVISNDGKTMTQTMKGTNAEGKPMSATAVYDKQ
jgi:hypothetical protein